MYLILSAFIVFYLSCQLHLLLAASMLTKLCRDMMLARHGRSSSGVADRDSDDDVDFKDRDVDDSLMLS